MNFPNVEFKSLNIEENLNNLIWYAKPENSKNSPLNFYKFTIKLFPELKDKIHENMTDNEVYLILEKEIKPILENLAKDKNTIKDYQHI